MNEVLQKSQNADLIYTVEDIIRSLFKYKSLPNNGSLSQTYLKEIGFAGLFDSLNFVSAKQKELTELSAQILEVMGKF